MLSVGEALMCVDFTGVIVFLGTLTVTGVVLRVVVVLLWFEPFLVVGYFAGGSFGCGVPRIVTGPEYP